MIYFILLDDYQSQVSDDSYAVTYAGSLEDCRAQTGFDGHFSAVPKSGYTEQTSEPKSLTGPGGAVKSGRILGLEEKVQRFSASYAAAFAEDTGMRPVGRSPVSAMALLLGLGLLLGVVLGSGARRLSPRRRGRA